MEEMTISAGDVGQIPAELLTAPPAEIQYTCRGPIIDVPVRDENGKPRTNEDGSAMTVKDFAGCGQSLNELIDKIPFDGVLYEYECPACKTKHKVRRTPKE